MHSTSHHKVGNRTQFPGLDFPGFYQHIYINRYSVWIKREPKEGKHIWNKLLENDRKIHHVANSHLILHLCPKTF